MVKTLSNTDFQNLTISLIQERLLNQNYIASTQTATTLLLAIKLRKPIIVEGGAGVGKTSLAKAFAKSFDLDFIKLQCYEGIDESKALYEWEYGKQLLYTQILKETLLKNKEKNSTEELIESLYSFKSLFFSEEFLLERPILKALRNREQSVLLLDEIDKSDPEFEAFLFEILSEYSVTIPELGTLEAKNIPIVFLTSNGQRALSDPLRRRALYLYLDYPDREMEEKILLTHIPNISRILLTQILNVIQITRDFPLKKHPGVSEGIEWAKAILTLLEIDINALSINNGLLTKEIILETLPVLVKYKSDYEFIVNHINSLI
ncbi:MoxR family ATPase [bacterium]|nr:MoxR family ATPase [bacterium]